MRYLVLACDYDGTLAWDGQIAASTVAALLALRDSGRKTLLVTGRELADLMTLLPDLDLFDRIVAENGAMLYRPASKEERTLADPPPEALVAELIRRRVAPLSVGRVIVATCEPNETVVLDVIRGARPRAPGDLQQGRRDDLALGHEQGDRSGRRARRAGPVAAQLRGHRRRRERSRLSRPRASAGWRSPTPCPRSRRPPIS